jgi:hypothetical protein
MLFRLLLVVPSFNQSRGAKRPGELLEIEADCVAMLTVPHEESTSRLKPYLGARE